MNNFVKLNELGLERIRPDAKVRSTVSYAEGIVLGKDIEQGTVEIEWKQGTETSVTTNHISRLGSVVMVHQ